MGFLLGFLLLADAVSQAEGNLATTLVGSLIAALQGFQLRALADLKERITRLENRAIPPEYRGPGPHPHMRELV